MGGWCVTPEGHNEGVGQHEHLLFPVCNNKKHVIEDSVQVSCAQYLLKLKSCVDCFTSAGPHILQVTCADLGYTGSNCTSCKCLFW